MQMTTLYTTQAHTANVVIWCMVRTVDTSQVVPKASQLVSKLSQLVTRLLPMNIYRVILYSDSLFAAQLHHKVRSYRMRHRAPQRNASVC